MKKEWLIIICISLSLSMVTGLSYFFKAAQKYQFDHSFFNMSDFEITHHPKFDEYGVVSGIDYYRFFQETDESISDELKKSSLDLEGTYKYGLFGFGAGYVVPSYWDYIKLGKTAGSLDYINKINGSGIQFAFFEEDFYESKRFNEYFKIISGRTPETENEILLDLNNARKFNLNIGDSTNLTVLVGLIHDYNPPIGDLTPYTTPEVTLVGTYLPIQHIYRIALQRFSYSYTYFDYIANRSYLDYVGAVETPAIFTYKDFSRAGFSHPFQDLYLQINATRYHRRYINDDNIRSGYILAYNREHIQFNSLNRDKTVIAQQALNTSLFMPFQVNFVDYLGLQLNRIFADLLESHLIIQILNIPIILFSILITQNFVSSNKKQINEELLLLRLRSVPLKQIKIQIIISAFMKGIACTIFGIIGGFGTFFVFEEFIGRIFFDTDKILLTPYFELNNILSSFILGTVMNGIAIIPKLVQAQKPKYGDIAESLNRDDLHSQYDEKLFLSRKESEIEEKASNDANNELFFNRYNIKKKSTKKKKIYEDQYFDEKKIFAFLPYLLIGVGFLPIIFNILILVRYSTLAPDILMDIVNNIINSLAAFQFLTLFGMAFFVAGVIWLIVIQKPHFFAKIAKRISGLFTKKYSHIIGLELVRQKKWSRIIAYLAIFASLLITTNISFNSYYRYETLENNMYIGADFRVQMNLHTFTNPSEIQSFERDILNYETNNISAVKDVSTCFIDTHCSNFNLFNDFLVENTFKAFFLNTTDYLQVVKESGKPLPYPRFEKDILKLLPETKPSPESIYRSYVSSQFLIQTNSIIGDTIEVIHRAYSPNLNEIINQTFQIEIIGVLDFVPGLYNNSGFIESSILIDLDCLNQFDSLIHGNQIIQLININDKLDLTSFLPIFTQHSNNLQYDLYNQNWDDSSQAPLSIRYGTTGFFGLEYLNFTLIGFLLIIELSLTIILINKENSNFNGLLLTRGVGRKMIFKMELVEALIVFLFAFLIGSIIGLGFSFFIVKAGQAIIKNIAGSTFNNNTSLPIYCDVGNLMLIFGLLMSVSFIILVINYLFSRNESIEKTIEKDMI